MSEQKLPMKLVYGRWDVYARSVGIHVEVDGALVRCVAVYQNTGLADYSHSPPMISWSALGEACPEEALAMAQAMREAVRVAGEFLSIPWGRVTPPIEGTRWRGEGMPEIFLQDGRAWVDPEGWIPGPDKESTVEEADSDQGGA